MAEVSFYHVSSTSLDRALPRLLEEAWSKGDRLVVKAPSRERVEELNRMLWVYGEASFLPHGSAADGNPAEQPIWLTDRDENPNGATLLCLLDGTECADLSAFARCLDLFDGNDPTAAEAARVRWRRARQEGHALDYWQQTRSGWQRKG